METALGPLTVTAVQTPWGWAGLAATSCGLLACAWPYQESEQALKALSRKIAATARRAAGCGRADEKPEAGERPHSGQELAQWATAALLAFFWGSLREIEKLPVDGRLFTVWQRKVYETVRAIKPGKVMSYGEVAAACGSKSAARAVGRAMAGNPLPLFIPCHRVVRGGGRTRGASGQAWQPGNYGCGGTAMKVRLLAHESGGAEG